MQKIMKNANTWYGIAALALAAVCAALPLAGCPNESKPKQPPVLTFTDVNVMGDWLKDHKGNTLNTSYKVKLNVDNISIRTLRGSLFTGAYVDLDLSGSTIKEIPGEVPDLSMDQITAGASLTSITLPSSLEIIEKDAFYFCTNLASVEIPENVTDIKSSAFSTCYTLAKVIIKGNKLETIGENAFYECISLNSIIIPDSVTSVRTPLLSIAL